MKLLAAAAALAALTTPAFALDYMQIRSERAFRGLVVDRVLVDEFGGRLELGQNGSLTGQIDRNRLRGGWAWKDGQLCRRLVIGNVDQGTECQTVFIRANQLVIKRGRYGQNLNYTIYAKR